MREGLLAALATRQALIYIDRIDHLTSAEHAPLFGELVSALLRRTKVKLLLTCRKSLAVADEQPLNIQIPELSAAEARLMLQNMAPRVPHTHAAALAELCGNMPLALRLCGCALGNARVRTTPEQLIATLQLEAGRLQELHALSAMSGDVSVEACIASS